MKVTFDPVKRADTLALRGLDMADAGELFTERVLIIRDEREDYGEDRFVALGLLAGRLVACVYTDRGEARRIISLRKANARKQSRYRDAFV